VGPGFRVSDIGTVNGVLAMTVKLSTALAVLVRRQKEYPRPVGVTVDMHVVASILFFARQCGAKSAVLSYLAGFHRLVDQARNDVVDPFRQKSLHGISPWIILCLRGRGKIEAQSALTNYVCVVIKTIDDENRDVHIKATE
jgi:hypothetical protein